MYAEIAALCESHAHLPRDPRMAQSVRHHPDQPHWLELAEERMAHLERRIALTSQLVFGSLCGVLLGALIGFEMGDASMGFAVGGLLGTGMGRLWHEKTR